MTSLPAARWNWEQRWHRWRASTRAKTAQDEKQLIRFVSILADKVCAGWMALAFKNVGLDTELAIRFREDVNRIAAFWREVGNPDAVEDKAGVGVPLANLKGKLADLLAVIAKHTKNLQEAGQLPQLRENGGRGQIPQAPQGRDFVPHRDSRVGLGVGSLTNDE